MEGIRLKRLREKRGLTQDELAKELKLSSSLIRKLETNRSTSIKTLNIIADYFKVSIDYLQGKDSTTESKVNVVDDLLVKLIRSGVLKGSRNIDDETWKLIEYAVRVRIDELIEEIKKEKSSF